MTGDVGQRIRHQAEELAEQGRLLLAGELDSEVVSTKFEWASDGGKRVVRCVLVIDAR